MSRLYLHRFVVAGLCGKSPSQTSAQSCPHDDSGYTNDEDRVCPQRESPRHSRSLWRTVLTLVCWQCRHRLRMRRLIWRSRGRRIDGIAMWREHLVRVIRHVRLLAMRIVHLQTVHCGVLGLLCQVEKDISRAFLRRNRSRPVRDACLDCRVVEVSNQQKSVETNTTTVGQRWNT
jgi:hypothetical protein